MLLILLHNTIYIVCPENKLLFIQVYHHFRPADVIKVRLQMQLAGQRGNLVGMVLTAPTGFIFCTSSDVKFISQLYVYCEIYQGTIFTQMVETEGTRSLYLGLAPALTRSVVYGGLRLGLYEPCKHLCSYAFGSTNFAFKFASGVIAGGLATALTNPMEVLKVLYLDMNSLQKCDLFYALDLN